MLIDFIGIPHSYGTFDCITLVQQFYSIELGLTFEVPPYSHSRHWMRNFTDETVDAWASKYAQKVTLTAAKNYDLISFKSDKTNHIIHFGLYITPNKLLHVEEGKTSRIDTLTDYWVSCIHAIYRHDKLV